ncbi:DUF374 domain-containing protein [Candidatus Dependentiae bacterium]|nr:DUF374 domain-containing protein [Candidatus Dependentiae bacterium]
MLEYKPKKLPKETMLKKIKNSTFLNYIIKYFIYLYLRFLFYTYKLKIINEKNSKKKPELNQGVFYFWHQNIISATFFFFKNKCIGHCIISPSRDGKIMGFIVQKLGFKVLYGSAFKNPLNLVRKSLDVLELNKRIAIVGDGSRGPAFKLQRGVIYLAAKSKQPLIFIDCKTDWAITFKSWDRFKIPLPFSKIQVKVNTPTHISSDAYKSF